MNRTINGLLTTYKNCDFIQGKATSHIKCKTCKLNTQLNTSSLGSNFISVCKMLSIIERWNYEKENPETGIATIRTRINNCQL